MTDDGTMLRRAAAVAPVVLAVACSGQSAPAPVASAPSTSTAPSAAPSRTSSGSASERLRVAAAHWRLPAPRSREVVVAGPHGLVVAGGLSSAKTSTSTVWTLSPHTGHEVSAASLATGVHDAAGVLLNGSAYVFAGGNTTTVDDVQQLPPVDGTAHVVGHLPQPRSDLAAVAVGGQAYVLGGFDGTTALSGVLRTTDGRHFSTVARLAMTVRYAAVVAMTSPAGEQLLVFGGEHDGVPVDDVQQVDLTTGRTKVVGHLSAPLAHEAAFILGGAVWLAGGRSHDQLQSRVWRWEPSQRRSVAVAHLPYAVADAGVAVAGSTAYLVGGETPDPTDRVVVLKTAG